MVYLNENNLTSFPIFCQYCDITSPSCIKYLNAINFDCKLRVLRFDSNNLREIFYKDLSELENLEILNLDNNLISYIEASSFLKLKKLDTLILSRNSINSFASIDTFDSLTELKLLNLSWNRIEFVSSRFFNQLFKLETLDLSFNSINLFETESFFKLTNLRNLHINDNAIEIQIENETFIQLDAIQNIYLSASILNEKTNGIFIDLFKHKNSLAAKWVLKRHLYKSLFLIGTYLDYDCNMTLFFVENNVHYNFKSESNIFDYFSQCSQMSIKNSSSSITNDDLFNRRDKKIFSNILFYMFYLTLLFILFMGVTCLFVVEKKKM